MYTLLIATDGFEYAPLSDHSFATPADADLQPFDAQADHLTGDGDKVNTTSRAGRQR